MHIPWWKKGEPIRPEAYPGFRLKWNILVFAHFGITIAFFMIVLTLQKNSHIPHHWLERLYTPLDFCGWCHFRYSSLNALDGRSVTGPRTSHFPIFNRMAPYPA